MAITVVFEQSAHCDWDWLGTFDQYYTPGAGGHPGGVETILDMALSSIAASSKYVYVFCEVAYLQQYVAGNSARAAAITKAAANLQFLFSSGGFTSADNLLVHTEAFIRNYLLGRLWVQNTFAATPTLSMWIPDDFGHDAQLPSLLTAMGFTGVGFERMPWQTFAPQDSDTVSAADNAPSSFLPQKVGIDFTWEAADGSTVQAHWLCGGYGQGNSFMGETWDLGTNNSIEFDLTSKAFISTLENFNAGQQGSSFEVPWLFVPIDIDFTLPYTNFPDIVSDWNGQSDPGFTIAMASFEDYLTQVETWAQDNSPLPVVETNPPSGNAFIPHPYYSGCYASKPALKALHYKTVRTLLMAEAMEIVLEHLAARHPVWSEIAARARADLAAAWTTLAPSTHHDYITGTAADNVYFAEQLPLLRQALAQATDVLENDVLANITSVLFDNFGDGFDDGLALFNALDFSRTDAVVETRSIPVGGPFLSSTTDFKTYTPVQYTPKGTLLVQQTVPAIGYQTVTLSTQKPPASPTLSVTADGSGYALVNANLKAVITTDGMTGLYAASDLNTNLVAGTGNQLLFYNDSGNVYRFGMELVSYYDQTFSDSSLSMQNTSISIVENGPLRVRVRVVGTVAWTPEGASNAIGIPFTIDYALAAGEDILRVTTTGAAPRGTSVMVAFPFSGTPSSLAFGTTANWDLREPRTFFQGTPASSGLDQMTFEPTHDYVVVLDVSGNPLGAIYHQSTPPWAIYNGALYGCILRNAPGGNNGIAASDYGPHTAEYAVRIPTGLPSITSITGSTPPIADALQFTNPVVAVGIPKNAAPAPGKLPSSMTIASSSSDDSFITTLKAGSADPTQLIIRLYQPTNQSLEGVSVTLDASIASIWQSDSTLQVSAVTAMETASAQELSLVPAATSFSLTLPAAVTTVALSRPG